MPNSLTPDRDPRRQVEARLAARREAASSLARRDATLANLRLAAFLAAALLAWLGFVSRAVAPWISGIPFGLFILLIGLHDRVIKRRTRAERAAAYWSLVRDRMDDAWIGKGDPGSDFSDPGHRYAEDLDLFGSGSLFERVSVARTSIGRETLGRWLLAPAALDAIHDRQRAIAELRDRPDLREDLATEGVGLKRALDPEALRRWVAMPAGMRSRAIPWVSAGAAAVSVATLLGWLLFGLTPLPFVLTVLIQGIIAAALHRQAERVIGRADRPAQELRLLSGILARIEREPFAASLLRAHQTGLETAGLPPSRRIGQLASMGDRLEWGRNAFFAPFAFLLMWMPIHAWCVDRWRERWGGRVVEWLRILGEMEALASLAGYAFENPDDPFPEMAGEAGPLLVARGVGHPLLPRARCVRNDIRMDGSVRLLVVSGSNMSGKSTLLRAIGVNAVLALAGAPVRATAMRVSHLSVGASIRRLDSLQGGTSRFYAEIQRLRDLMAMAEETGRLLFLIDEIFNGTNSHDRRIGAEGVLRGYLKRRAIGIVTTHDLAITQIAADLAPSAENVHFEDQVEDGRIVFDYRLRSGVVSKSNALALMRAVGLDLEEGAAR